MIVYDLRLIAAWLRPCSDAALTSLKKISFGFFSIPLRGNELKEASFAGTGVTVRNGREVGLKVLNI